MSDFCSTVFPILADVQAFLNSLIGALGFLGIRAPDFVSLFSFLFGCTPGA